MREQDMSISMARAKALCSDAELALVKASTKQEIGRHTAARVRQMETRARKLRDKWRDQADTQRRSKQAKAGARDVSAADRSAEKSQIFDEVLTRFTAQLAKAEADGKSAGPMGRRRSTTSKKSATNRATRAVVRGALQDIKRDLDPPKKKKLRAAAKEAAAAAPAAEIVTIANDEASVVENAPKKPARPTKPAAKKSRVPVGAKEPALLAGRDAQGLRVTKQQQLSARTAAKQDRLKASGLIRVQKNRSAANKRSQGRRDSR
jgi:hypothetical protein